MSRILRAHRVARSTVGYHRQQKGHDRMYYPPPYPQQYPSQYPQPVPQPNGTAVAVEAVLSFFGVYGVGWLIAGKPAVGVPLMIGGFLWDLVALIVVLPTAGFGLCCIVPLHLGFIATSTILLAANTKGSTR